MQQKTHNKIILSNRSKIFSKYSSNSLNSWFYLMGFVDFRIDVLKKTFTSYIILQHSKISHFLHIIILRIRCGQKNHGQYFDEN